ncbi:MAG: hypothetical protein HC767_02365 [Akkermansiaceae bacterium]|nr:hypothetical protein [Akkermansiaceae bacterium]
MSREAVDSGDDFEAEQHSPGRSKHDLEASDDDDALLDAFDDAMAHKHQQDSPGAQDDGMEEGLEDEDLEDDDL